MRHPLNTTHTPAVLCILLLSLGASLLQAAESVLVTAFNGPDPVSCGIPKTAVISYQRETTTPGLRGYEITIGVNGPATIGIIADAGGLAGAGLHQMYVVDNGDGTYTVSDALLGSTSGLLEDADLITVDVTATGNGTVELSILSFKLRDPDNAPITADTFGDSFTADCTAPPAVSNIDADPGHEKVLLSWSMANETDVDHYEIFRGLWYADTPGASAYPEYDDLTNDNIPARPADRDAAADSDEWEPAGSVPAGTLSFTDTGTEQRGVYYYEVFPVDLADNGGAAAGANSRATNYWLGDVDLNRDGFVNVADISRLGASFGLHNGQPGYNNETDVGPTDDGTDMGVPLTDNAVDFEDLMIFSLNFSNVDPYKALPVGKPDINLAWRRTSDTQWTLELTSPDATLQGLRLRADLPDGVICRTSEGLLITQQMDPVFLRDTGAMDISLAILGRGRCFTGSGALIDLEFNTAFDPSVAIIQARGMDNRDLVVHMKTEGERLPGAFALLGNFPNPFNPSTTIEYELPRDAFVRLAVYGMDGGLVRTLVVGDNIAGRHAAIWDGKNTQGEQVASGLYFYRFDAGNCNTTRKMLLIK